MTINEYRDLVHEHTKAFKPAEAIKAIKVWLEEYARANNMERAVLGISGGKDSTIVAKLLVDVLGKDNVFGLLMPNGEQKDISDSLKVVELLDIGYTTINIAKVHNTLMEVMGGHSNLTLDAKINIPPRIRMMTLYAWGQSNGYRVAGTGNLSERTLGYFTKWGDGASDFNIIGNFTSLEVMRIGEELGLPLDLVYKTPDDGLSGMSDEEKLGITYIDMHTYLRKDKSKLSDETLHKIMVKENLSNHKRNQIPLVDYRYCQVELPDVGKELVITLKGGEKCRAFLTITSAYIEGFVFETVDYHTIRLSEVIEWEYAE